MECFSEVFKQAATNVLDSSNIVVGTITLGGDDFIQEIKNRGDIEINEVTMDNRDSLPNLILRKISNLLKTKHRVPDLHLSHKTSMVKNEGPFFGYTTFHNRPIVLYRRKRGDSSPL
ncbi:MAG: hypothetical protein K8R28_09445 [Desulfobacterales bacterium]|nr:hypothetical protein [Desulfobacterales bacterium]